MTGLSRRLLLVGGAMIAAGAGLPEPALAGGAEVYTGWFGRTALEGYDAVSYQAGAPVKGSPDFSYTWKGVAWHFANAENRDRFRADPEAFAPRYGGHCAYAVARGARARGNPLVYRVVDGRLYLNLDRAVQQDWERDVAGEIRRADKHWPLLLK